MSSSTNLSAVQPNNVEAPSSSSLLAHDFRTGVPEGPAADSSLPALNELLQPPSWGMDIGLFLNTVSYQADLPAQAESVRQRLIPFRNLSTSKGYILFPNCQPVGCLNKEGHLFVVTVDRILLLRNDDGVVVIEVTFKGSHELRDGNYIGVSTDYAFEKLGEFLGSV